ncbi:PLP-dependent aminotransferase family protein [Ligilactobacillus equi]|nr:PLP-dependent aminotransferase family protein [Ligilactobacillus equi]
MLTYNFQNVTGPLYEYIYLRLKEDILSGKLAPHEKLPSKRSFANNNGISTITIQNAYDQLISEGYVYTRPKKGYYVANINQTKIIPTQAKIDLGIQTPPQPLKFDCDLSSNQLAPKSFPFSVWTKLLRQTIAQRKDALMEVSPTGGQTELRQAIAEHLKSFRGMLVDPNQIIVGAGTEYLYSLLIQLLGQDKKYCTENPGYKRLAQIYQQAGVDCTYIDIDDYGVTADDLRNSQADIAHLSPNHHFPTGISMPANRRYEILAWANEMNGRYIIEDDYDSEFRLQGRPIPTLFSSDACEKVIYLNTFSKSLTPTIRISYMVLPAHLANRFYQQLSFYACTVSNFEQYTLAAFIGQGYFEKHINRMRLYYRRQRSRVIKIITTSSLAPYCEILENDAGLHFVLKLKTKLSDQEITQRMAQAGIHLTSMAAYYLTPEHVSQHLFIINYSNINTDKLHDACQKLTEIIKKGAIRK